MNPDVNAELPQLNVPEQAGARGEVKYGLQSPEAAGIAPELRNAAPQGGPAPMAPPMPAVPMTPDPSAMQPVAATPATANDSDLIEKEWVMKAKQIVEHTKDDPYRQNSEMHKIKADYIKKRYNKDIKLVEE